MADPTTKELLAALTVEVAARNDGIEGTVQANTALLETLAPVLADYVHRMERKAKWARLTERAQGTVVTLVVLALGGMFVTGLFSWVSQQIAATGGAP